MCKVNKDINLASMRASGKILAEVLRSVSEDIIKPGITSYDVSQHAENIIRSYDGATPAFKGYRGFPEAACVSVNDQVVHAIPDKNTFLKEGDIVSVDCGVIYEEHYTDACRTVAVGTIGKREKMLLKATRESLDKGIAAAVVGNRVGDISFSIQHHVERNSFSVSLLYVGHGIGRILHGDPQVPNYGPPGVGPELYLGQCLAIEPVVFDGPSDTHVAPDGWTILSSSGNLSAHFEDTIIITEKGPEIITRL